MDLDDLLHEQPPDVAIFNLSSGAQKQRVLTEIEAVFESFVDVLLNEGDEMNIDLKRPTSSSSTGVRVRRLCFPGKSADEAWRFAMVVRILEIVHEALCSGVVLSKREIYYRDPALFASQYHVDKYVDEIACTFDVARSSLNVTAAAKGLVIGPIAVYRQDGSVIDVAAEREGVLIPSLDLIQSVDMKAVQWILVVEKEATLRSLAASDLWNTMSNRGILVTGKGYPDVATRQFVQFLTTPSPRNGFTAPEVHALMDFDPDGLAIMSVYKHGSKRHDVGVQSIRWLGLQSHHIELGDSVHNVQGILTLTARDRKKARDMLATTQDECSTQQLQTMLLLNVKAELQLLESSPGVMSQLLNGL